jgi:hypothetical protein
MGAPVTTPINLLDKPAERSADLVCEACEHPNSAHDAIGHRYCRATMNGALARGCICSGLDLAPAVPARA